MKRSWFSGSEASPQGVQAVGTPPLKRFRGDSVKHEAAPPSMSGLDVGTGAVPLQATENAMSTSYNDIDMLSCPGLQTSLAYYGPSQKSEPSAGQETLRHKRIRALEILKQDVRTNVQDLEKRIQVGERGLGSLATEMSHIRTAIEKRVQELKRLKAEVDAEERRKHDLESEIAELKRRS